jgi:hypothetical protein
LGVEAPAWYSAKAQEYVVSFLKIPPNLPLISGGDNNPPDFPLTRRGEINPTDLSLTTGGEVNPPTSVKKWEENIPL